MWGDYFGKSPGSYPHLTGEVLMLPPSKESFDKTRIFPLGVYRQAWELWNADLKIADRQLHPRPVLGDARSLFSNWADFFNNGQPWTYGTGKYPIHISMLITQWDGLADKLKAQKEKFAQIGMMSSISDKREKEKMALLMQEVSKRAGVNPYLVSALFQAGTGSGIHVPVQGPLGMSMVNGMLELGLKPPSEGSSGLQAG